MYLTDLLALEDLELVVHDTGASLQRPIGVVHTMEIEDPSPYLRGGELLMTAGVWMKSDEDAEAWIAKVAKGRACAVVFGVTPPSRTATPKALVEACRRYRLPLLEAPAHVPFVAISKAVAVTVTEQQQAPLRSSIARNKRLVRASATATGPQSLIKILDDETSLRPWLVTAAGSVRVPGSAPPEQAELDSMMRAIASGADRSSFELPSGGSAHAFAVAALGANEGYLVCRTAAVGIGTEEQAAIDQTISFLELYFTREHATQALEARFASELVDLIAAGPRQQSEATARLHALGFPPDQSMAVLAVSYLAAPSQDDDRLWASLLDVLSSRGHLATVAPDSCGAVAVLAWPGGHASALEQTAHDVQETLVRILGQGIAIGVGPVANNVRGLSRALTGSRHALPVAELQHPRGGVATYRDVGSHRLLLAMLDDEIRESFTRSLIDELSAHDRHRNSQLVATLDAFLASCGQWQATADELHVHVNTLRHRLTRIEKLTGRQMSSMDDRVDFYLALSSSGLGERIGTARSHAPRA